MALTHAEGLGSRPGDRGVSPSEPKGPKRRFVPFASLRGTQCAALLAFLAVPAPLAAQLHGQHWDVTAETTRPTVGDTVTLAFRVRLDERDLLFDTVPKPALTPPDWVRILSVEKLQRQPDRIFIGRARLAFYRPGHQAVPIFQLPFMRSVKGLSRGTLMSDSASVEVVPVLSAGSSATLRDIKEPAPRPGAGILELVLGLAALGAGGWLAWRARRPAPAVELAPPPDSPALPPPPDPYELALRRLEAIAAERWATGDVARHYAEIADALRDYLEAYGIPARERTTIELRWSLPPSLVAGTARRGFEAVFGEADLVKFARRRPGAEAAHAFLGEARTLLTGWRAVNPSTEASDAVR